MPERMSAGRPLTWPFLSTGLAILGQGLWFALVVGTPCQEIGGLLAWIPLALAIPAGLGEAHAARLRGCGQVGFVSCGLVSALMTFATGFLAGFVVVGEGGCFS